MAASLEIKLKWLENGVGLDVPEMHSAGAAGCDLRAAVGRDEVLTILPGKRIVVPCGFAISLPEGFEAQLRPRSGLAAKFGVTMLNSPGTIDADYRGEIRAILINHGEEPFEIRRGDRIAQMVVAAVTQVQFEVTNILDETGRGTGGFGSTGYVAAQ